MIDTKKYCQYSDKPFYKAIFAYLESFVDFHFYFSMQLNSKTFKIFIEYICKEKTYFVPFLVVANCITVSDSFGVTMSTCASQLRGNLDCSLGVSLALPPLFQIVLPIEKTLPKETVQQRKVIPSLILRKYYMRKPWINIDKSINNIPFLECTTSTVSLLLLLCGNFYFLVVSFFFLCGNRNRVAILYQHQKTVH